MEATKSGGAVSPNETTKPRRLGRGLSSLLNIPAPVDVPAAPHSRLPSAAAELKSAHQQVVGDALSDLTQVRVDSIVASPFQPRQSMDEGSLQRLADSIRRSGVLQPILVRPASGGGYELVAGERRWRAARLAGLERLPALVRELSDEQAAEHALVENVQRDDLNPMDRAWALKSLGERFALSHSQLAERVGLERSSVANLIRLTELEPEIAGLISSGRLSAGHGKALLGAPSGSGRITLAKKATDDEMSVRALERLIQAGGSLGATAGTKGRLPVDPKDEARLAVLADLQRQIGQQLGTKVSIGTDRRGKRGRIVLEFYGLDHFDSLMSRLGVKTH
ncbi:putative chromosome-partitioning protein ParB [Phycisphaerales bacterium]|nr:putative chromosome-partitioning protein ParB [Phycisphaerales bacterium]